MILLSSFTQGNIKKPFKPLLMKNEILKKYKPKLSVTYLLHQVGINKEEYEHMKMQNKIKGSSI